MYKIGDKVMHQNEGACQISHIVKMNVNDKNKDYFRLTPLLNENACVYISLDHDNELRVRPVITLEDAEQYLSCCDENPWIADSKKRIKFANDSVHSFDFYRNMMLIKMYLKQEKEKQLSPNDRQLLHSAQKLVYSEIAMVMEQKYDEVEERIIKHYIQV